jgi:ABC-type bacteriocin/lantibiotic exporter with double-glycine peptidase domain
MTSFLQLVGQIQQPILSFLNMVPQVIHATASMDRLEEIRTASQKSEDGKAQLLSRVGITAEDVAFRYAKGDRNIVEHFSHEFKPGSKTALMGETGAGKTTLFRLILGFVKPESGKILVWESPEGAHTEADEDTRGNFVFVPQGNSLMSGTIRYNLLIAKPDATEDELRHALHTACAEFVDELPDGIDTELGERGCGLSEGQSQRIAIARGLLRPGAAMLLDEISSSLDEKTEKELFRRLFEAFPQKTMIFITHRRAVVDLCDSVVEL